MAKLIPKGLTEKPMKFYREGGKGGLYTGLATGVALLTGMNPFVAYLLAGLGSHAWLLSDSGDKRICAFESVREALIQLFVAD